MSSIENPHNSQFALPEENGKIALHTLNPVPLPDWGGGEFDLPQFFALLRRRALVIGGVAIAVTTTVWVWTLAQTPVYEGRFQLLVEAVTADRDLNKLTEVTKSDAGPSSSLDYQTQIQVLRSPELMTPIVEQIRSRYSNISYGALVSNLLVIRLQETKILEVRYRDSDPDKVKFVLDQISEAYLKYSLQERQTNLRQGIEFVEDQLSKLQTRVDKLQDQLQNFRQRYNFIDPSAQSQQISTQTSTIAQQRLDTQKQLAETQALYANLQGSMGGASALQAAPVYQRLLGQLREIESKIAIEASRFSDVNPAIQTLRDQRDNLLPLLRQEAARVLGDRLAEVASQIEVLQVRSQAIAQAESSLNQQLKDLPVLSRRYADLQRELNVAIESLNRFLATREKLQVDAAQKEVPWQQISAPERPGLPTSPNMQRNFLLGVIAGLLLGTAAAVIADRLDNTFHAPDDLKDRTKLPLLAAIPFNKTLKGQEVDTPAIGAFPLESLAPAMNGNGKSLPYVKSNFLEAFRSLHANICLLGSDAPIRSLVISSALPGDGKSTVALNLAKAAAAMGQRVLLVDADLRRPKIGNLLNLPDMQGLSNLIATNVKFNQVLQHPPSKNGNGATASDNLYILTAGQIPPDPTKLLSSKKMRRLMERFEVFFDLVIYDTPPLLGLADSSLLATHTDGIVLIVGMGRTDRSALMQALDGLKLSRTPVLGVVANGIRSNHANAYHYYHRYYGQNQDSEDSNGQIANQEVN